MPKTLFILNDPPYATERSYNGLRLAGFAVDARRRGGESVPAGRRGELREEGSEVPQGDYNAELTRAGPALDPARPVVMVCNAGKVSQTAADVLARRGFDARSLAGMKTWSLAWSTARVPLADDSRRRSRSGEPARAACHT